jgi:hypothetical protein
MGQFAEARSEVPGLRLLADRLDNRFDRLHVVWLEAKVAAGLDEIEAAVRAYERVRAGFLAAGIAYYAALATMELAEVFAARGRTAEVAALVEASVPLFEQQGVHAEARRALHLFLRAVEEERASAELARFLVVYLERARHDPALRFEVG